MDASTDAGRLLRFESFELDVRSREPTLWRPASFDEIALALTTFWTPDEAGICARERLLEILDALDIAHGEIKKLCALQRELAERAGKEKTVVEIPAVSEELYEQIKASHGDALDAATQVVDKLERQDATAAVEQAIVEQYGPSASEGASDSQLEEAKARRAAAQLAFEKLEKAIIRERIAVHKKRPDGRGEDEIRDISIEVGVTPRTHGSAVFTRGETQALVTCTLGTADDAQKIESFEGETWKNFMLHYNFPPFSVGETGRMTGPGRREKTRGAQAGPEDGVQEERAAAEEEVAGNELERLPAATTRRG